MGRHDRQPEPKAAGLAAAVRFGPSEPLEDPHQVRTGDAAARVGDRQHHMPILEAGADLDAVTHPRVRDHVLHQRGQRHREAIAVTQDSCPGTAPSRQRRGV